MQVFRGTITNVWDVKSKDDWAAVDFEVTELEPNNPDYPQIAKFGMFKKGEYVKYAESFANDFPIGTEVEVEFNFKRSSYQRDGEEQFFYSLGAWKVTKLQEAETSEAEAEDPLPF